MRQRSSFLRKARTSVHVWSSSRIPSKRRQLGLDLQFMTPAYDSCVNPIARRVQSQDCGSIGLKRSTWCSFWHLIPKPRVQVDPLGSLPNKTLPTGPLPPRGHPCPPRAQSSRRRRSLEPEELGGNCPEGQKETYKHKDPPHHGFRNPPCLGQTNRT